jgi:hypothetical protein
MDVPERHPTRTPARMSQTRSAGPGRPHAAAAPSQCHWCPPCRCPETPPDTLRASRPAKIHLRWQNSCRICSHFQMPFSAAVPTVRHPACGLPRSPSAVSSLHPPFLLLPYFLFYYSTSSAFRGLPFAHKTARFAQAAAVDRNFLCVFVAAMIVMLAKWWNWRTK